MNPGIYYLIARNTETNEKVMIELTDRLENRYCTKLSYIDKLTTQFTNKEQLINRLYDNKYISFKNADIYIEYSQDGIKKFEELLYKPSQNFTKLITPKEESKIDMNNSYFRKGLDTFFEYLNKRSFRSYINNSKKIPKELKTAINIYYNNEYTREAEDNKSEIIKHFQNYKVFRDFTFLIQEYLYPQYAEQVEKLNDKRFRNYVHKKEPYVEEVKEHESDDEFLTEDDLKNNIYPYNMRK